MDIDKQGSLSWCRKVFEGVHSHVMDLSRISDFGPDSYFESKLEQNQKFELLKSGAKSDLGT